MVIYISHRIVLFGIVLSRLFYRQLRGGHVYLFSDKYRLPMCSDEFESADYKDGEHIMKIVIFGLGTYYEQYKYFLQNNEIVALIDNDKSKQGTYINECVIIPPYKIKDVQYDAIVILAERCIKEMRNQLIELGVPVEKIKTIYDLHHMDNICLYRELEIYCLSQYYNNVMLTHKKRIAILTYSMGTSGGDRILLQLVKALKGKYSVNVVAAIDGPLKKDFINLGVSVIIDRNLPVASIVELEWLACYDLLFINGANFSTLFSKDDGDLNAIWWIHSSGYMNDFIGLERIREQGILQNNVSVYGVSKRAVDSFLSYVPLWNISNLCYGIPDEYKEIKNKSSKIIFALVGSCQPRKGQDIFIEAIDLLSDEEKECCEFWLIGPMGNNDFTNKIKAAVSRKECINILGWAEGEELYNLYSKMSILVCPSLEDTMPIVCAEAMMCHTPCIVSDFTGTAQFIVPKENGLICKKGDVLDLVEKIRWMIKNNDRLKYMGDCARKTYEEKFSFKPFKSNILKIIHDKIK